MIKIEEGFIVKRKRDPSYGLITDFKYTPPSRLAYEFYRGDIRTHKRGIHGIQIKFNI